MAIPVFMREFGYTRTDLGLMLALFSIIYSVGKFANGMLADRANPRYFMAFVEQFSYFTTNVSF